MQLTPSHSNIVEKILRDKEGRLVRATFCVYENGGRIKARLVSATVLEESPVLANQTLLLANLITPEVVHAELVLSSKIVSPYFNSNLLYSIGLQPRAPTTHELSE